MNPTHPLVGYTHRDRLHKGATISLKRKEDKFYVHSFSTPD